MTEDVDEYMAVIREAIRQLAEITEVPVTYYLRDDE